MGGFRITYLYLYPYIYYILYFLYSVRITLTLEDGRWMRPTDGAELANLSTTGRWISSRFHQILPHVQSRRLYG